jgi:hypothetical protein
MLDVVICTLGSKLSFVARMPSGDMNIQTSTGRISLTFKRMSRFADTAPLISQAIYRVRGSDATRPATFVQKFFTLNATVREDDTVRGCRGSQGAY